MTRPEPDAPGRPGSNELLAEGKPDPDDFDVLVERYGRVEASRRWMAIFGASDGSET